jgi:hypothetical protein
MYKRRLLWRSNIAGTHPSHNRQGYVGRLKAKMGTGRFLLGDGVFRIKGFDIIVFNTETEFHRSDKKRTIQSPCCSAQRMLLDALIQDIDSGAVGHVHHFLMDAEFAAALIKQEHWTYKELLQAKHTKEPLRETEVIVLPEINIKIGSNEYNFPVWITSNLPAGVITCDKDGRVV